MAVPVMLLLCLGTFYSTASADHDLHSEYAHHVVLDPAEKMKLYWTVDWDAKTVSFAVEAETTGWVEFGFSNGSGQMIGSDVVIGWVKDNKGYLTDRFVTSESIPPIDKQQDYELTGSEENGGKTVLKFKRKFDTCDPQDRKLEKGAINVVYAYGTEDPVSPMNMKKEVDKGSKSVLLLNKMDSRTVDKTGWTKFAVTANVTIPANDTTYWCTLVKVPKLESKHHITAFAPIIKAGNEGLVHHYVVFGCYDNFTENDFRGGVNCLAKPEMFTNCQYSDIIAAWAQGSQLEPFYLPQHVGVPIGGKDSPTSFLLEVAYVNPQNIKGRQDSSGVNLFYTDKLRTYDSAIVSTGVDINDWQIIPPKQENWISTGYCMHQCTEDMLKSTSLPGGGINVFAAIIHFHSTGRAAWTKHVRDGKELPEIARLNNYDDFKFQDTQFLTKTQEVHIQPGDDIIHSCKYDSMNRNKLTKGGLTFQDEMCVDLLYYYPRISGLSLCRSTSFEPSLKLLDKYFDVDVTSPNVNPLAQLDFDWNNTMVADFRKYESDVKAVVPKCLMKNVKTVADIAKFNKPIPVITEPLPAEKSDCPKEATSPAPVSSQPQSAFALFFGMLCAVVVALQ